MPMAVQGNLMLAYIYARGSKRVKGLGLGLGLGLCIDIR